MMVGTMLVMCIGANAGGLVSFFTEIQQRKASAEE